MQKRKKLIVGNWKMNPENLEDSKKLASDVKRGVKNIKRTDVVLCPPFVYLALLQNIPSGSLFIGAQNANAERSGSFTGEVSFSELSQFKVKYVIVGHSERRAMGETDQVINKKVKAVVSEGMTAILCVGESKRDHSGDYFDFIKQQVLLGLKDLNKKSLGSVVIAYEPIWAIGAKEAMSSEALHEMSIFIRKVLKDAFGVFGDGVRVLYGGSVDRVNADLLVRDGNVSGLLVGRQSLRAKDFVEIIKLVDAI